MRQAIHIFRKDLRAQAIQIAITLIAVILFAVISVKHALAPSEISSRIPDILEPALIVAWWLLTVRVVQSEALSGDRQFWCTRPYSWKSLLAAKALFILAFVNLPMLIADTVILHTYGFELWPLTPGLLCRQLLLTTVLILPIASLAAVTTGMAQLLTTTFPLAVLLLASSGVIIGVDIAWPWGPLNWIRSAISVLAATAATVTVILWQYKERKTVRSRILVGVAFILVISTSWIVPWTWAFGIQSKLSHEHIAASDFKVSFDLSRKWLARTLPMPLGRVDMEIPQAVTAVPRGLDYVPEGLAISLHAEDGTTWRSKRGEFAQVNERAGILSMNTSLDGPLYQKIKSQTVTLRATLYLTLIGHHHETSIPIQKQPSRVPGAGVCSAQQDDRSHLNIYSIYCSSAFRSPPEFISAIFGNSRSEGIKRPGSYSPFPADLQISPVIPCFSDSHSGEKLSDAIVVSTEPIAFIKRDFELSGIRLSDLEAMPPAFF